MVENLRRNYPNRTISPPAVREAQARRACVLLLSLFKKYFSDFCERNYLNIYRTDLHKFCRIGRTLAVDLKLFFSITGVTNFVGEKPPIHTLIVRMPFTRAAPPA